MSRGTMMTSSQSHSAPTDGGGRIRAAESRDYIQGSALDGRYDRQARMPLWPGTEVHLHVGESVDAVSLLAWRTILIAATYVGVSGG